MFENDPLLLLQIFEQTVLTVDCEISSGVLSFAKRDFWERVRQLLEPQLTLLRPDVEW